jgi:hypothetical protein
MAKGVLGKSDSHDGLRQKLQTAITAKHGNGSSYSYMGDASVHDVFPGKVVHTIAGKQGKLFASPYSVEEKSGEVTLGDPQAVEPAYRPLNEAAQGFMGEATAITEAAYDKTSGKLKITVIRPGFNTSKSRFYPATTLKRDHKIFEGAKMFKNHQTVAESKARPEGSVDDWVADITETSIAPDGSIVGVAQVHDAPFKEKLAGLQEAGLLSSMGISIRAAGLQQEAEVQGTKTMWVESFKVAKSVDFVTFPGAGGKVDMLEAEQTDVEFITVEKLTELRPDIIKTITEAAKEAATVDKTNEQLTAELAAVQSENAALKESNQKADVKAKLTVMLTEAKLPEPAEKRIKAQFAEATKVDGISEAITAEAEYIKSLGVVKVVAKPGVRAMGESSQGAATGANEKEIHEASVKAWMGTGMNKEMAEAAASNLA